MAKREENGALATLEEKWSKCLGCPYNHHKKKGKLKSGDFQLFNCFANIDEFPCDRIPELYPHKLVEKLNNKMVDGKVIVSENSFELSIFYLEFYDQINDNITRILVASDSKKKIEEHFKEVVKNKVYSHLLLYKIEKLGNLFKNYTILIVPDEVNKVVFPELNIELEHYGKPIMMKELTYNLKRHVGIDKDKCKASHFNVDERLSIGIFEENNEQSRTNSIGAGGSIKKRNKHRKY